LVNSRLTHFTATGSILSCAQNGEAPITNFQAPKKLQSFKLQTCFRRSRTLFGIWCLGFRTCRPFCVSAKWSRHPFFRSYGARLPSSLTRFHSRALAQLCPPTCVGFRYGQPWEHPEVFLGSCFNGSASAEASTSLLMRADRHFQSAAHLHRNVTSELNHSRCRNIKPAVHRLRPSAST
jgi:hypothetical protein